MHTMQSVAVVSIIGCRRLHRSGDPRPRPRASRARALRRRLRLAGRQRRLGARSAPQPQRRQARPAVHHQRGGARLRGGRHLRLPPPRAGGRARAAGARDRGRPLRVRTGSPTLRSTRSGTGSRTPGRTSSRRGRTGLPELAPPTGRLIANPGCHATAVLLALGPISAHIDPESVVVDSLSGTTGAGRTPKDSTHAGAVLENVAPYRVGRHQHVPEIAQQLGFPGLVHARTCCLSAAGSSRPATSARPGATCERLLEEPMRTATLVTVLPEGVVARARARPGDGLRRDRRLRRRVHRPHDRRVRRGQPWQGRGRAGRAERQSPVRASGDDRAQARRGAGVADVRHRGQRVRGGRRRGRHPPVRSARRGPRPLDRARGRGSDVDRQPPPGGSGDRLPPASRARPPRRRW